MRENTDFPRRCLDAGTALVLLLILAACAGAPPKSDTTGPGASGSSVPRASGRSLRLPPSQWESQFIQAEEALSRHDWMSADTVLSGLDAAALGPDDLARRNYLQARVAHLRGDRALTLERLAGIEQAGLHPALRYRIHNFQRHLLALTGDYLGSAQLGAALIGQAPAADQAALIRSVWHDLQRLDADELEFAAARTTDPDWGAWLSLAALANRDLARLSVELQEWLANFPEHPAANPLPGGLEYLRQSTQTPDRVALLLPLSGRLAPAAKSVLDGYLAAHYRAQRSTPPPPEILVLDSARYPSSAEAYQEAVNRGAKLVVGPLSKSAVAELAMAPGRSVPVLALNHVDGDLPPSNSALVQFSLAPEDEAAQIAELAFGHGARRALVLRPAGAWGDKMELALRERWQALGGSTADVATFSGQDDYSAGVKSGLGIAASEQRRRQVRDMLATNVEFTPRRRQDLDAIFMLARNGPEARALKPLLAFHYAGALPVYATSSVYSGVPDSRDKDLDGLRLVELPWLLDSNPTLKRAIAQEDRDRYPRLNALGADAYRLQNRLVQLQAGPDALLKGDTGLLTMNPRLQIQRELEAAEFDGARLRATR